MHNERTPKAHPLLQFILTESELSDIYSSINFQIGSYTTKTQLRLSKSENLSIAPEDLSEDCYLLSLRKADLAIFLQEISSNDSYRSRAPGIIVAGLERGKKPNL
jgi:hypothetical protein